jgi:iron complex outermembrane receptor protein
MSERIGRYHKFLITAALAFFLVPCPGYAEPAPMGEELLLFQDIPSVYGASKYEQKVTEAPSSVSVVTAGEIKKYGYRNFAEILESIRGFHTTNDRNYSYLGVRGFGLPSDYNNRVLLILDGHQINDNIYDSAGIGSAFPIDIDIIDRVEIIRGPSSSLYGTSAFFAVINVITKRGRDLKGPEVSGEAGTFDTRKTRLSYGNRFKNGMELFISGTYFNSHGEDRLFFEEFDDPTTNNGIAEGLDYDKQWGLFSKLTLNDFVLEGNYNYRKKGVPTAPWGGIFNDGSIFTVDEQFLLGLTYAHTFANRLDVLARISYNYYNYYGDYPYAGDTSIGEPPVVTNDDSATGQWVDGELQLTRLLLEKHKATVGASFQHNLQQDQATYYPGVTGWGDLDDERDPDNWAAYLQDEFTITEKLILNAGVRYDHFETFGGTTNPRAALIYNPFEKTTIKAIFGRAFRAPNAYELYYNDGDVTQKSSADLSPETIETYELIYEQYIGDHLRATIVGFQCGGG